jgi:hypothetical protein
MKLHVAAFLLALAASAAAWGDTPDAPARIAYLGYAEGEVRFQSGRGRATSELPERLLRAGDRIVTGPAGRAELAIGTALVRLDESADLALTQFDAIRTAIRLEAGSASLRYRPLYAEETFTIRTPFTDVTLDAPGEYRVDVGTAFTLTVHAGAATLATAGGPVRVAVGQRVSLAGREAVASLLPLPPADNFDDWVLERELRLAAAAPPVETGVGDYDELAIHGSWVSTTSFGSVWSPYYTGHWTPFRHGRWQRDGHGWSWADGSPWGFFSFSNGQWAFIYSVNRWCWVPPPVPTPYDGTVARYTKPFGRPSGPARPSFASIEQEVASSGSSVGTSSTTIFRSFGGGTASGSAVSSGSWSGGSTLRSSGSSFGRPRSTSGARGGSIYASSGGSPR